MISCPFHFQLSEKGKPYVDIQGLTASTMEILLDFVYTETVHVTVENVQELLPAACLLQLKGTAAEACAHRGPQRSRSWKLGAPRASGLMPMAEKLRFRRSVEEPPGVHLWLFSKESTCFLFVKTCRRG